MRSIQKKYERLLIGGIWSIVRLSYDHESEDHFVIDSLTPVQVPSIDMQEIKDARQHFTTDEWLDLLLRTIGWSRISLINVLNYC